MRVDWEKFTLSRQSQNRYRSVAQKIDVKKKTADLFNWLWDNPKEVTLEGFRERIAEGADILATEPRQWSLMHIAIAKGYDALIDPIMQSGYKIERQGPEGYTALLWAARHGQYEMMRQLLEHYKASPDSVTTQGNQLLHAAAEGRDPDCLRLALSFNPDMAACNHDHKNSFALFAARHNGNIRRFTEGMELMIGHGADINQRMEDGKTLLHHWSVLTPGGSLNGYADNLEVVLKAGADMTLRDDDGLIAVQTELSLVRMTYRQRAEKAIKRWDEWLASANPETVNADDLMLFSNIGRFDEAFVFKRWEGHETQAIELLRSLPPAFQHRAMRHHGWLAQELEQKPSTIIDGWQCELQPTFMTAQRGRVG